MGEMRSAYNVLDGNPEKMMWNGFKWHRTGSSGRIL
jgi:hypothetical protein